MSHAVVKVFMETHKNQAAMKIMGRLGKFLGLQQYSIEQYHKGGYVGSFQLNIEEKNWEKCVFQLICKAQLLGRNWQILSDIEDEISLTTTSSVVSGINLITIDMIRTLKSNSQNA